MNFLYLSPIPLGVFEVPLGTQTQQQASFAGAPQIPGGHGQREWTTGEGNRDIGADGHGIGR